MCLNHLRISTTKVPHIQENVEHETVSMRLKLIEMIQKQGHGLTYELTLRHVEQHVFTCELLAMKSTITQNR